MIMEDCMAKIHKLIIYSGMAAFVCLVLTFMPFIFNINFRFHKVFGVLTLAFALIHLSLFLYKEWKLRISHKKKV
jgi:hypothetical protein